MASRYHEVYRRWQADPEGFWAEAAAEIDWFRPWDKVFDASTQASTAAGSRAGSATLPQRGRPPCRRRAGRPGRADPRQRDDRQLQRASPIASCATRWWRLPRCFQDLGIVKGDRVIIYMPMVPEAVVAMLACARIGAVHSVVFGGFASQRAGDPHRRRDAQAGRSPPPAGSSRAASSPTSRCSTQAIALATSQAGAVPDPAARSSSPASWSPGATSTMPQLVAAARAESAQRRMRAGRGDRPALHPLHLGHDRPAQGHRARQWRPHGRAQMVDGERVRRASPARRSGRRPTSAGWSAIPTSSTRRCCMARPRSCSRASRSARRMPAPSGGSSPSMASWRCSPRRPPSAPSRRRTRAASIVGRYDSRASAPSSWPASAPTPTPSNGPSDRLKVPVIDHWWQTETGSPMSQNPVGPRHAAGQIRLARRADAGLRHPDPRRCRTAGEARARSATWW